MNNTCPGLNPSALTPYAGFTLKKKDVEGPSI